MVIEHQSEIIQGAGRPSCCPEIRGPWPGRRGPPQLNSREMPGSGVSLKSLFWLGSLVERDTYNEDGKTCPEADGKLIGLRIRGDGRYQKVAADDRPQKHKDGSKYPHP